MESVERPPVAAQRVREVAPIVAVLRTVARIQDSTPTKRLRALFSSLSPCLMTFELPPSRFCSSALVTGARAAGRTLTYGTAESAEAGPDCGAAPGITRNRADKGASGRAACRTLKGSRRNGVARRTG